MSEAPAVRMLWEDADPHAVLRDRFGLADGPDAARWVAHLLQRAYGIDVRDCDRVVMSDRNALAWVGTDRGPLVVKWCIAPERFARLAALADLTATLDREGVPMSVPLPACDGARQVLVDGVSVGVQRVVDADLLDHTDDALVHAAGRTLASLHAALARTDAGVLGQDAVPPLRERVAASLDDAPAHLPAEAVEALRDLVRAAPDPDLPVHVVHGDYRSANVLCRDGRVVAVLDLEEAHPDHAVVDLAQAAVLLGTRYHDWGPVPSGTRAVLRAGYESVRPLTDVERAWWEPLVPWWSLRLVPAGEDPTGWGAAALACAREAARR